MDGRQQLKQLEQLVEFLGSAPTLEQMHRRTLADKGIAGPTAAHVIEEVHCPYNLAYMTFTTGSSAFQNIVGVTFEELADRHEASTRALEKAGVPRGGRALVTYAPLVNVYTRKALDDYGLSWSFLRRSSRDAALVALCRDRPDLVIGESGFLRVTLEDAVNAGLSDIVPRNVSVLCSGTPLDLDLLSAAERFGWRIHDLYGCQEFGWLALDGTPLRGDISLVPSPLGDEWREIVAGGLPLADSVLVTPDGHVCGEHGDMLTYRRRRTRPEYDVVVTATPLNDVELLERAARSILRIKGRVVRVHPQVRTGAPATSLALMRSVGDRAPVAVVTGPEKTRLFDTLVEAQRQFQMTGKTDPAWIKKA